MCSVLALPLPPSSTTPLLELFFVPLHLQFVPLYLVIPWHINVLKYLSLQKKKKKKMVSDPHFPYLLPSFSSILYKFPPEKSVILLMPSAYILSWTQLNRCLCPTTPLKPFSESPNNTHVVKSSGKFFDHYIWPSKKHFFQLFWDIIDTLHFVNSQCTTWGFDLRIYCKMITKLITISINS